MREPDKECCRDRRGSERSHHQVWPDIELEGQVECQRPPQQEIIFVSLGREEQKESKNQGRCVDH